MMMEVSVDIEVVILGFVAEDEGENRRGKESDRFGSVEIGGEVRIEKEVE